MPNDIEKTSDGVISRILPLVLFFLFVAVLSIALVAGTKAYTSIEEQSSAISEHRIANAAIANTIRSVDSIGAIEEQRIKGSKSLVIKENTEAGIFENRIYLYNGNVILEYAESDEAYVPARGEKLVASDMFDFEIDNGVIHITTDEGTSDIYVRSFQPQLGGDIDGE